jgi:hypothetical protein
MTGHRDERIVHAVLTARRARGCDGGGRPAPAVDPDSIARWADPICDEHLRDHVGWIRQPTARA